jgi:hypothetical protein
VMRVMPRLQKLVSSVRSGRNHCGRVVGNPDLGIISGLPVIRSEFGRLNLRWFRGTQ